MNITIVSANHDNQIADPPNVWANPAEVENLRNLVKQIIADQKVDLICEESDPCRLSVAQDEAWNNNPRILWKNMNMTSQQRLQAGIWKQLLTRPSHDANGITIDHRIPADHVREEFFRDVILNTAKTTGANNVLVLCGDMHTEALKVKIESILGPNTVVTNRTLTPVQHWQ